jgi:hypothetical protein
VRRDQGADLDLRCGSGGCEVEEWFGRATGNGSGRVDSFCALRHGNDEIRRSEFAKVVDKLHA